jgi:hypothetical protein
MSATIFDEFNEAIRTFVTAPGRAALLAGTGSYSVPFRGTLFGCADRAGVARALETRRVDVLWLGANPNVPTSGTNITGGTSGGGDFDGFLAQMNSDGFGEHKWDGRQLGALGWDPVGQPTRGWAIYAEALADQRNHVVMANFVPWGSAKIGDLWDALDRVGLTAEAVEFCDKLNAAIVCALKPRLILIPKSLGGSRELAGTGISMAKAEGLRERPVEAGKTRIRMLVGEVWRPNARWPVAYVPHPASLRVVREHRATIVGQLRAELMAAMHAE